MSTLLSPPTGRHEYWKDSSFTKSKAIAANKLSSFLVKLHIAAANIDQKTQFSNPG